MDLILVIGVSVLFLLFLIFLPAIIFKSSGLVANHMNNRRLRRKTMEAERNKIKGFPWEYGTCRGREARKHYLDGRVQFKRDTPKEVNNKEIRMWQSFDKSWWKDFKADE